MRIAASVGCGISVVIVCVIVWNFVRALFWLWDELERETRYLMVTVVVMCVIIAVLLAAILVGLVVTGWS